jgi:acetyl esterase/lipase
VRYPPPILFPGEIREVDAAGIRAQLYRPHSEQALGLLVYFHGGGWVTGDWNRTTTCVGRWPGAASKRC